MKQTIILTITLLGLLNAVQAQVGIGTSTPDPKAILDLNSNSKGILIPRLTTTERNGITSPTEGLIIFNAATKRMEVYTTGNATPAAYQPATINLLTGIGSSYNPPSGPDPAYWSASRGMGQSFTATGNGMLTAISIKVESIEAASTSSIYELNIFAGTPTPLCGNNGTTCSLSAFGEPIATSLVAIKNTGVNKLVLHAPISLENGQVYTFTITPTILSQGFQWSGHENEYLGGASFGIDGHVSSPDQDFYFQTHYIPSGWRAL